MWAQYRENILTRPVYDFGKFEPYSQHYACLLNYNKTFEHGNSFFNPKNEVDLDPIG